MSSKKSDALRAQYGANISQAVAIRPGAAPTSPTAAPGADRYAGAVKSRTFAEMPVDVILADAQPRETFDPVELDRLAASIKRYGQLAPIRIRHDGARGVWVVLVGERRLRACKLAGLATVRVEFVEREMTEADVLAEQVVENAVRADLLPVEQGRAYKRLMELNGSTAQDVADSLGVEATAVYRALALLRLPDDVAELVDAGEIKPTAAYEIAKLQIAGDQREVAAQIVKGNLDHKATVAEVRQRQKARTTTKKGKGGKSRGALPAEIRRRGPNGCRVAITTMSKHDMAQVVEDLRAIADALVEETEEQVAA
jgi:ParB family chromosome partitioning protein